ncbi:MAG: hypothetical protein H7249_17225 [Chitinophagaceae bacterium]|nr:hypothetical protein [Oligoflexus sp.]
MKTPKVLRFMKCCAVLVSTCLLSSCFVFSSKNTVSGGKASASGSVLGASLGPKASAADVQGLESLYAVPTTHAPAPVRPDPDTSVRNLLLQYREAGSTVAREIGRVDEYRSLLGGANVTFTVVPQDGYDSTSVLAEMKVAYEVCGSLVDPNEDDHPGWQSILPSNPSNADANLKFLTQRLLGIPSDRIDLASIESLKAIIATAKDKSGKLTKASYIPACSTLLLDAEGLLL